MLTLSRLSLAIPLLFATTSLAQKRRFNLQASSRLLGSYFRYMSNCDNTFISLTGCTFTVVLVALFRLQAQSPRISRRLDISLRLVNISVRGWLESKSMLPLTMSSLPKMDLRRKNALLSRLVTGQYICTWMYGCFDSLLMSFSRSSNIAVQLVERGLASVIRHRKDDENRSQAYDQLMIDESKWATMHIICFDELDRSI